MTEEIRNSPKVPFREQAERARSAAHRPALALSGPYGRPLHPMLVPLPIGSFALAFAFDVASKVVEGRPFGRAAAWLIALGVVTAVIAAVPGMLDARRLAAGTVARRTATLHMVVMGIVTVLHAISFLLRRADEAEYGNGTPVVAMVLSIAGLVLLVVGVWQGNSLVYRYGTRVVDEEDQLVGHVPARESSGG